MLVYSDFHKAIYEKERKKVHDLENQLSHTRSLLEQMENQKMKIEIEMKQLIDVQNSKTTGANGKIADNGIDKENYASNGSNNSNDGDVVANNK